MASTSIRETRFTPDQTADVETRMLAALEFMAVKMARLEYEIAQLRAEVAEARGQIAATNSPLRGR